MFSYSTSLTGYLCCSSLIQHAATTTSEPHCKDSSLQILSCEAFSAALPTVYTREPASVINFSVSRTCLACHRHLAASEGSYKVTEWLLSEKADINSLDRFKRTPLEASAILYPHTSRLSCPYLPTLRSDASTHFAMTGCCPWRLQ